MRIFGITGGSGSGKSTVSSMLAEQGVFIVDTDKIARKVVEKGTDCLKELCASFGDEILLQDGSLNRKKLAKLAFASKEKTELLNRITHKHIKAETESIIKDSNADLIGIDGAVIIGSPIEILCEKMVLVTADIEIRLVRIIMRDGLTPEEAKKRLNAQPSDEFYRQHCDYVIDNSSTTEDLKRQVAEIINKIKGV